MISIHANNISKTFGTKRILTDISFSLRNQESLVITGSNGSGKTTLCKIICNIIKPSKGSIEIKHGEKILPEKEHYRYIGFSSPMLTVYEELSLLDNLTFFAYLKGIKISESELIRQCNSAGLSGREKDPVSSFSSGMKSRVKILIATLGNPVILILDEPFANMDKEGRLFAEKIMSNQKSLGILILAGDNNLTGLGDSVIELQKNDKHQHTYS